MRQLFNAKTWIIIILSLVSFGNAHAQLPAARRMARTEALLPEGYKTMKLQLPFSNAPKEYVVKKVPIDGEPGNEYYILNGDIIVGSNRPQAVLLATDQDRLWKGDVPIYLDESVTFRPGMCREINDAVKEFHKRTKVRFVRYTGQTDYIKIRIGATGPGVGGFSSVGRCGRMQEVVIKDGMSSKVIIHELLHALGAYHEQSRPDRNNYIWVDSANFAHADDKYQFQIERLTTMITPYDFESIMHYPADAFAKVGTLTIHCKQNGATIDCPATMGSAGTLSDLDISGLNELYRNVAFAGNGVPAIAVAATGNEQMELNIMWETKDVQMVYSVSTLDRFRKITAKDAFKLTVLAPQKAIAHKNTCNDTPEVLRYENYAAINPILAFEETGADYRYVRITVSKLPVPFKSLQVKLVLDDQYWKPGTANATNPYGNHGQFIAWIEDGSQRPNGYFYEVHGGWFDTRRIPDRIRTLRQQRPVIQSDRPMNVPGGYGERVTVPLVR